MAEVRGTDYIESFAARKPDDIALIDGDRTLTWAAQDDNNQFSSTTTTNHVKRPCQCWSTTRRRNHVSCGRLSVKVAGQCRVDAEAAEP